MITRIFSLYQDIDDNFKEKYSAQKYGEVQSLNAFSQELNELIKLKNIITDKSVMLITIKYPYSNKYKKNFAILAENIARMNQLPIVYSFYNHPAYFYDNQKQTDRKAVVGLISKNDSKKYFGYSFIVVEDSVISGATLNALRSSVNDITQSLSVFSILDLRGKDVSERELNEAYFVNKGVGGLISLLKLADYVPTTQMLRTLGVLDKEEKRQIIDVIPNPQELVASYKEYTGQDLI